MATRSAIGIKNEKGEIKAVYCHWDGYPDWVGRILVENYNTREKVEELLALGYISSLRERVKPNEGEEHSFDKPLEDVTVAYHRDRGEDLVEAKTFNNLDEMINYFDWSEYFYVFDCEEWLVSGYDLREMPVKNVLSKE